MSPPTANRIHTGTRSLLGLAMCQSAALNTLAKMITKFTMSRFISGDCKLVQVFQRQNSSSSRIVLEWWWSYKSCASCILDSAATSLDSQTELSLQRVGTGPIVSSRTLCAIRSVKFSRNGGLSELTWWLARWISALAIVSGAGFCALMSAELPLLQNDQYLSRGSDAEWIRPTYEGATYTRDNC